MGSWISARLGAASIAFVVFLYEWYRHCRRSRQLSLNRTRMVPSDVEDLGPSAPPALGFSDLCSCDALPLIFSNLRLAETSWLRCASRCLAVQLDLKAVMPCLAVLVGLDDARRKAPGLRDVLGQTAAASRGAVVDAVFADALRLDGRIDMALVERDSQGRTPLLVAVQRQLAAGVETLLSMSAPPDSGDIASGWSPLMFAVSSGNKTIAEILVAYGASVNFVARPHGYTPLIAALAMGSELLTQWLLTCGADPHYTLKTLRGNLSHFGKEHDMLKRVLDRELWHPSTQASKSEAAVRS